MDEAEAPYVLVVRAFFEGEGELEVRLGLARPPAGDRTGYIKRKVADAWQEFFQTDLSPQITATIEARRPTMEALEGLDARRPR